MRFLSGSGGTKGTIKGLPEDFIVKEITANGTTLEPGAQYTPEHLGEKAEPEARFTRFVLQKRDWDTVRALMELSKRFGHGKKSFGYSGTKDRASVSVQMASIFGVEPEQLMSVRMKDISINGAWKGGEVELGSNLGNAFGITVKGAERPENADTTIAELDGRFPNYFDRQRFGYRLNNFRIGMLILKDRVEEAVLAFLTDTSNEDNEQAIEARKRLAEERDFKAAMGYFPRHLRYERMVIEYMSRYDNYANAFRKLPRGIAMLFIHAVESGVFNACLEKRLEKEDLQTGVYAATNFYGFPDVEQLNSEKGIAAAPLVGYETDPRHIGEYESEVMEKVGITAGDFKIKWMPELSMRGSYRVLLAPVRDLSCNVDGADLALKFGIPSGSYATVLLNEITKSEDLDIGAMINSAIRLQDA